MAEKLVDSFFEDKWDSIINSLDLEAGSRRAFDVKFYKNADGRFNKNIQILVDAGYDKVDSVEWINYYPEKHFDNLCVIEFEKFTRTKCARAWISRIRPGKMAPLHQDIDDNLEEYLSQGELIRYSVFISKPTIGAVFICRDSIYHLQPQGTIIEWEHFMDWHAGTNCGLHDKYMFNFIGIKNV